MNHPYPLHVDRPAQTHRSAFMRRAIYGLVVLTIGFVIGLDWHKPALATPSVTTIVVDTSDDLIPTSLTHTCTYTEGAFFFPAADGKCTLRRALREASARPDTDRPINIVFNLPSGEAVDGVWTVEIASTTLELKRKNLSIAGGQVILDGDTQPGGRPRAQGPKIMIDTNDNSFEISVENNEIRNLGFQGGGVIFLNAGNNLIEDNWMGLSNDGQQIEFRTPGQPNRMAGGGIFIRSSDNIIRNNVISGAFAKAVDINSGNQNNLIENNFIGTRSDGTVPTPFQCTGGVFDAASWYGGWGIAISGSNNQVIGNRIAGLDNVRSANDTPPRAIEIFGANHMIRDNIIGVDSADNKVGVCGQGIKVSDSGTDILDNTIVGSKQDSEDAVKAAILTTGNSTGITVRGNLVEDGPDKIYDFGGTQVPQALRLFRPARITAIDGVSITGANGEDSACPNCRVDLYLDDADNIDEALNYLGQATANAQGNFTFTLSSPLQPGFGLRTLSTTQALNVIPGQASTTTTKNSVLYLPVSTVTVTLPATATVGVSVPVTLTLGPVNATQPLTYTIAGTDLVSKTGSFSENGVATTTIIWNSTGDKTVNVTVQNEFSSAVASREIGIVPGSTEQRIYLPAVTRP
jgi:hypothetical protein